MKSGYNVWSNKPLADLTATDRPICYGIVQTGPELPGGIPCVRVIDIKSGKVDVSRLIHTSTEIHESYKRTQLQVGDLLFALRGKIGELAIVDSKLEGGNLTRGVALIALTESYSPEFYLQFLSSEETKKRLNNALNGSALKEITIDTLRKFAVPTPELPEQKAIAKALSDTDALIAALEKLITKKRAIKTATMQQLLTGKTRLPGFCEGKGYKDSELGRIPEDWEIVELGKLCRCVGVGVGVGADVQLVVALVVCHGDAAFGRCTACPACVTRGARGRQQKTAHSFFANRLSLPPGLGETWNS